MSLLEKRCGLGLDELGTVLHDVVMLCFEQWPTNMMTLFEAVVCSDAVELSVYIGSESETFFCDSFFTAALENQREYNLMTTALSKIASPDNKNVADFSQYVAQSFQAFINPPDVMRNRLRGIRQRLHETKIKDPPTSENDALRLFWEFFMFAAVLRLIKICRHIIRCLVDDRDATDIKELFVYWDPLVYEIFAAIELTKEFASFISPVVQVFTTVLPTE